MGQVFYKTQRYSTFGVCVEAYLSSSHPSIFDGRKERKRETINHLGDRFFPLLLGYFSQRVESESEMCGVCMIQPSNECVFEPCNHAVTCEECALEINSKEGTNRCPECNRRVTGIKSLMNVNIHLCSSLTGRFGAKHLRGTTSRD